MDPRYPRFCFLLSTPKHMHVLLKSTLYPIQNLHLMHLLFFSLFFQNNAPSISPLHISETNLTLEEAHKNLYLNMTSLLLLLLLILCGSLHACTPRPLTKNNTTKHHFDKVVPNIFLVLSELFF